MMLSPPAHWLPQDECEGLSVGTGMYPGVSTQRAVEARQCLQREAVHGDPRWWRRCAPDTLSKWCLQQPRQRISGRCIDSTSPLLKFSSDCGDPHDNFTARIGTGTGIWWPQLSKEMQDCVATALRQERPHALGSRGAAGGPSRGARP